MYVPQSVRILSLPGVGAIASGPADGAEPVLFLPGWGASKELWWNTLRLLGNTHTCVAVDLPGTNATPFDPKLVTIRDMAGWVAGVCEHLQWSRVTLVGHSLGGNLAAQTALDFPQLISRLVLVGAALETDKLPARARLVLSSRVGHYALKFARWASGPLALLGRYVANEHPGGSLFPMARRTALFLKHNTDDVLHAHLRALDGNVLNAERLQPLHMPILFMHGAGDAIIPIQNVRAMASALPNAQLTEFPRSRHAPFDTEPQKFADTLSDWLRLTQQA